MKVPKKYLTILCTLPTPRFHVEITQVDKNGKNQFKVRGAVIINDEKLAEKDVRYVYFLIRFPMHLIPRTEWSGVSTDGYALKDRKGEIFLEILKT